MIVVLFVGVIDFDRLQRRFERGRGLAIRFGVSAWQQFGLGGLALAHEDRCGSVPPARDIVSYPAGQAAPPPGF